MLAGPLLRTFTTGGATSTSSPRCVSSLAVVPMSRRSGTLRKVLSPWGKSAEHRIGRAAFFEPLTFTVPLRASPPTMRMLSTGAS